MNDNNPYLWTCGDNDEISHIRPIGSGGSGEVHEMLFRPARKAFARKLIRLCGRFQDAALKNEVRVINSIRKLGGHQNIIQILDDGWLRGSLNVYYVDMELAKLTLADYIDYHKLKTSTTEIESLLSSPVLVQKDCTLLQRMANMWAIATHIAQGLEFMHSHGHVHRDLKPSNVLFCSEENLWKLTDFGVSAEATTTLARTTQYSRGTANYRAPELLRDNPGFTKKSDIWSLGCILHELATLKLAFLDDWRVKEFDSADSDLEISVTTSSSFLQHHTSENIRDLLQRDAQKRPRSSDLCSLFSSYATILDLKCAQNLINCPTYPEYTKWKQLVRKTAAQHKLSFQLALTTEFNMEDGTLAITIRKEIVQRFIDEETRRDPLYCGENNGENSAEDIAMLLLCRQGDSFGKEHRYNDAILFYSAMLNIRITALALTRLSETFILKGDLYGALQTYGWAVELCPSNFWLWHSFCEFHLMKTDWSNAIKLCKEGMRKLPQSPWPMLLLSNLYAMKGDYKKAINMWDRTRVQRSYAREEYQFPEHVLPWDSEREKSATALLGKSVLSNFVFNLGRLDQWALDNNPFKIKAWVSSIASFNSRHVETRQFAAWSGNIEATNLLNQEEDVGSKRPDEWPQLHLAVWNMHTAVVRILLKATTIKINDQCPLGRTALHYASLNNDIETIEILLQSGADVSAPDTQGFTPMHYAAMNGHEDAIVALQKAGADILLTDYMYGGQAVHWASCAGFVNSIEVLMKVGADLSAKDHRGQTPMHVAALCKRVEIVKALHNMGANVNARDKKGRTPLHFAALNGHINEVEALVEAGADLSAQSNKGSTALHYFARCGHVNGIRILKRAGADVSIRNSLQLTPGELAIRLGHELAAAELNESGHRKRSYSFAFDDYMTIL